MKNLRYIDALRGFAVLGVLMVHCSKFGANNYPYLLANIFDNGAMGVQLFYIVSAFTLLLSVSHRSNQEQNPTTNFFIRRFFRIAPLYYLAVVYYLYQDGLGPRFWLGDMDHITTGNIISNFFFVHGVYPYWINSIVPGGWSISVEMFFYCLIPILVRYIKNLNSSLCFLAVALTLKTILDFGFSFFPFISDTNLWNSFLYFYFPAQLPVFAVGFILFYLLKQDKFEPINFKVLLWLAVALLAQFMLDFNSRHLIFSFVYLVLAFALSHFEPSLLVNRATRYLGKISFSMYLVHFAILHWMEKFGLLDIIDSTSNSHSMANYALRFSILLFFSVIASSITFYLIEKPFQLVGKKIISKLESKNPVVAS